MASKRTRSSSSRGSLLYVKLPRLLLSEVPSSSGSAESIEKYCTPNRLLEEHDILPLADMNEMNIWWNKEYTSVEESYSTFTAKNYYVNKFGFINILFEHRRSAVFMPTGCCKTIMSLTLEFFFSYRISEAARNEVRPLYSQDLSPELITKHEGQYYVLRLTFQNFPYKPDESFEVTLMFGSEPDLFNDPNILEKINSSFLLSHVIRWLHIKYEKRLIVIIDEIDYPSNMYMRKNASDEQVEKMQVDFNNILNNLSCDSLVELVVLFGIHPPVDVLGSWEWRILDFRRKADCVRFFMFTRTEVEDILKRYNLEKRISAVEKHYGNYTFGYFHPASVIAFVTHNGEFRLYIWCHQGHDILDINIKSGQSWLTPFVDGKVHRKYIDTNLFYFTRPEQEKIALYHYVFAGLLRMSLPNNCGLAGIYELSAGNLENLNIIARFLERLVGIR